MIEVSHLSKSYGSRPAVQDLSFTVPDGQIYGLLGPNGAGKSTIMNILTGYLAPTEGEVKVAGFRLPEQAQQAKACVGYLPEQPPLYLDMTVKEYLDFMYELKKVKIPKEKHIKEICNLVKINEVYKRLIGNLSKGYKQRVGIAQALLGNPPVLILDEPTVGLDPKQIIEIRNLIKNLGRNHTVVLSSHILPEVQAVCERILVINKGVIVADGTPDKLSHDLSSDHRLIARIEGPEHEVLQNLRQVKNVIELQSFGEKEPGVCEYSIEGAPGKDLRRDLFACCTRYGMPILSLKSSDLSLEDVFLRLTSDTYVPKSLQKPAVIPSGDNHIEEGGEQA